MNIRIVPPPPPPAPPKLTLRDLTPGTVFYRKSFGSLRDAQMSSTIYMVTYGTRALSLFTGALEDLAWGTEVVRLDATLHVSEP